MTSQGRGEGTKGVHKMTKFRLSKVKQSQVQVVLQSFVQKNYFFVDNNCLQLLRLAIFKSFVISQNLSFFCLNCLNCLNLNFKCNLKFRIQNLVTSVYVGYLLEFSYQKSVNQQFVYVYQLDLVLEFSYQRLRWLPELSLQNKISRKEKQKERERKILKK